MNDLPDEPKADPEDVPSGNASARPWLRALAASLPGARPALRAVNQLSSSLGYPGLAGVVALCGVVVVAVWIAGSEPASTTAQIRPMALHGPRGVPSSHCCIWLLDRLPVS